MAIEEFLSVWPEWRIIEKIGEGSFGKVYKAIHEEHEVISYSAIKIISIPQTSSELNSLRLEGMTEKSVHSYYEKIMVDFVKEIKLMWQMKGNTNIVSVEDYKVIEKENSVGWDIYIRMELLTSFVEYASSAKFEESDVIKLGIDICSALEYCARKKIIHRDVKPENIFVSDFGDFKIGDFGIARELEKTKGSFSTKGTFNYMAPEIVRSQQYDASVDTYSLGLVLYKLLNNNRLPFIDTQKELIQYQERQDAINKRLNGESLPPPINASKEIAQVVLTACSYDPDNRYQTADAMKRALESLISINESKTTVSMLTKVEEPALCDADFSNTEIDVSKFLVIEENKTTDDMQFSNTLKNEVPKKKEKPKLFLQKTHCIKCGNSIKKNQNFCPKCGSEVLISNEKRKKDKEKRKPAKYSNEGKANNSQKTRRKKIYITLASIILALVLVGVIYINSFANSNNISTPQNITKQICKYFETSDPNEIYKYIKFTKDNYIEEKDFNIWNYMEKEPVWYCQVVELPYPEYYAVRIWHRNNHYDVFTLEKQEDNSWGINFSTLNKR